MASENTLELGLLRTGTLYDSHLDTPSVQVVLQRLERAIQLTVSWESPDSPYAGWFLDRAIVRSEGAPLVVPEVLTFDDVHGRAFSWSAVGPRHFTQPWAARVMVASAPNSRSSAASTMFITAM